MNISFVSASAGSGKTYRITEIIEQRLINGRCRPHGLIATTFTIKAAQELGERVRGKLYEAGRADLAERTVEGLIGTVHSICGRLLARFAFEAGISPQIDVLATEEAAVLLSQAVETATDFAVLHRVQYLADHLGQKNPQDNRYYWKETVRNIIDLVRANDFEPAALAVMMQLSNEELLALLPPEATIDLDAALSAAIVQALQAINGNGDATKATQKYLEFLRDCLRRIKDQSLPWSDWVKLSKEVPAKNSADAAAPVVEVALRFEQHARLRAEMREYTALLASLAHNAIGEYRRLKEERGKLDFADLEQRALHLLRDNAQVRTVLRQDLDLLVVDEFQDTSPIQLGLFMQLAACAKEVVWVGDVKQAIYGFRDSDPELLNAVVAEVKKSGNLEPPLATSYRSVPGLVQLTNAAFTAAFKQSLGLDEGEVRLDAARKSVTDTQAVVAFLFLKSTEITKSTGKPKKLNNSDLIADIAHTVAQLLHPDTKLFVEDKNTHQPRPVEPRDIAVLFRVNAAAQEFADALAKLGVPVSLSRAGLLATPEARLAMACLRRMADTADSLAAAEIIALEGALTPEQWLENRLECVARSADRSSNTRTERWGLEEPFVHPALCALEVARRGLNVFSPAEALDAALIAANAHATVSAWGPTVTRAAQRRANLEALRALAVQYEESCVASHIAATIAGFMFWCDDLTHAGEDLQAADEGVNAVHVGTYHKAKGLEWPIVVCTSLDYEAKPRIWDTPSALANPAQALCLEQPLANRAFHYWLWPFGRQENGIPLADRVDASSVGCAARHTAEKEELRLLYVGLTRARDQLVLAMDMARQQHWLECLQTPWFPPQDARQPLVLPDGAKVIWSSTEQTVLARDVNAPEPDKQYNWFPAPMARTNKQPARLTPSAQEPLALSDTPRIIDFNARLPFTGKPDETALGDALHNILAADFANPDRPDRHAVTERILHAFDLDGCLTPADALAMVDRFRQHLVAQFNPTTWLVETPFEYVNPAGQRIRGFIDLALETTDGWVVIDHKSFPGPRNQWADKARSYSGQLACYRQSFTAVNRPFCGTWIHFTVGGGLAEVNLTE